MNDNMLYSIATCVGMDVVLIKRLEQGQVNKFIALFYRVEPLNGLPPYSANGDGWTARPGTKVKSLPELITDARNGGRKICVISIDESKTHFEATKDLLVVSLVQVERTGSLEAPCGREALAARRAEQISLKM
jgi:hypothetical protein